MWGAVGNPFALGQHGLLVGFVDGLGALGAFVVHGAGHEQLSGLQVLGPFEVSEAQGLRMAAVGTGDVIAAAVGFRVFARDVACGGGGRGRLDEAAVPVGLHALLGELDGVGFLAREGGELVHLVEEDEALGTGGEFRG